LEIFFAISVFILANAGKAPSTKLQTVTRMILELEVWSFSGCWSLVLGIYFLRL
jgi:hypothetical protein